MNSVLRSAMARALSFIPTAIATLITSRLILREFGVESFDSFALILTLINLVPLNNLGVGAAVTSAYADESSTTEHVHRVTLTAARTLVVSTVGTAAVALFLSAIHAWPTLLGAASGPNWFCGIAVALYALSFVPGLGQSVLLGVHRNHVVVWMQTLFTPLMLLGVVAVITTHVGGRWTLLMPPLAVVAVNVLTCWRASRLTNVSWGRIAGEILDRQRYPGASIRALSGPVLITTLAVPVALQSDRIVLSHVSSIGAVANYSVVMQIFAPVIALIAASAQPLWPIYTRARAAGRAGPSLVKVTALFGLGAALICAILVPLADPVGNLVGAGHVDLGWLLPVAAATAVVVQAMAYPMAMYVVDPEGVKVTAMVTAAGLPLNVGLSILLAHHIGAAGPLFATAAVVFFVQITPGIFYIAFRRDSVGRIISAPHYELFTVPLLDALPTSIDELREVDAAGTVRAGPRAAGG